MTLYGLASVLTLILKTPSGLLPPACLLLLMIFYIIQKIFMIFPMITDLPRMGFFSSQT